jgi:hypothetical protein
MSSSPVTSRMATPSTLRRFSWTSTASPPDGFPDLTVGSVVWCSGRPEVSPLTFRASLACHRLSLPRFASGAVQGRSQTWLRERIRRRRTEPERTVVSHRGEAGKLLAGHDPLRKGGHASHEKRDCLRDARAAHGVLRDRRACPRPGTGASVPDPTRAAWTTRDSGTARTARASRSTRCTGTAGRTWSAG